MACVGGGGTSCTSLCLLCHPPGLETPGWKTPPRFKTENRDEAGLKGGDDEKGWGNTRNGLVGRVFTA